MSRRQFIIRSQLVIVGLMLTLLVVFLADIAVNTTRASSGRYLGLNGLLLVMAGLLTILFRHEQADMMRETQARQARQGIDPFGAWQETVERRPWVNYIVGVHSEPAVFAVRGAAMIAVGLLFAAAGLVDVLLLRR